jgi:hypothetical protein
MIGGPGRMGAVPPDRGRLIAWTALFFLVALLLQLPQQAPFDGDTAYHLAVARLMREHGILRSFPWTPWSWLADHYADKELLFHVLLLPVTKLSLPVAGKVAGTVLGAVLLLVPFLVLRAERIEGPGLWALLPLASSGAFLVRASVVRPHLLAVPLALFCAWAAARRRHLLLFFAAALYPFCHVGWHSVLILVVLVETARLFFKRSFLTRPPLLRRSTQAACVAIAGLAVGLILHPHFPEILRLAWIQNVDVLRAAWSGEGLDLGGELRPLSLLSALRYLTIPLLMTATATVIAWRRRREDPLPLGFALAALCYAALALRSARFLEYLAPFSAVALALGLGDRAGPRLRAGLLGGAALFTAIFGRPVIEHALARQDLFPPAVAARVSAAIPPGARVFTCDWRQTGQMLLALPDRSFMVALDPIFFLRKDARRYRLWQETVRHPPPRPARIIRDEFSARYVLCDASPGWQPFFEALDKDPTARPLDVPWPWVALDLGSP